jgi:hypothetical protein
VTILTIRSRRSGFSSLIEKKRQILGMLSKWMLSGWRTKEEGLLETLDAIDIREKILIPYGFKML